MLLWGSWSSQEPRTGGVSVGCCPLPAPLCLQVPMTLAARLILQWFYRQEADGPQPPCIGSCQHPVTATCRPQQRSPAVPAQPLHGVNPHPNNQSNPSAGAVGALWRGSAAPGFLAGQREPGMVCLHPRGAGARQGGCSQTQAQCLEHPSWGALPSSHGKHAGSSPRGLSSWDMSPAPAGAGEVNSGLPGLWQP